MLPEHYRDITGFWVCRINEAIYCLASRHHYHHIVTTLCCGLYFTVLPLFHVKHFKHLVHRDKMIDTNWGPCNIIRITSENNQLTRRHGQLYFIQRGEVIPNTSLLNTSSLFGFNSESLKLSLNTKHHQIGGLLRKLIPQLTTNWLLTDFHRIWETGSPLNRSIIPSTAPPEKNIYVQSIIYID